MKKSQGLIFVLFLLLIVGILISGLMAMWNSQVDTNVSYALAQEVFYLAESGLEHGKAWAESNPGASLPYTYTSSDFGNGRYYSFRVESVSGHANRRRIISLGWVSESGNIIAQRSLEVTVDISSLRLINWSWKEN